MFHRFSQITLLLKNSSILFLVLDVNDLTPNCSSYSHGIILLLLFAFQILLSHPSFHLSYFLEPYLLLSRKAKMRDRTEKAII